MKIANLKIGKPKIGLALGSGAARGWAHIGVIKALEENQIFPDVIAGTSSGGVVGAFYAADGLSILEDALRNFKSLKDTLLYLDFGIGSGGIVTGKRWWKKFLETYLPVRTFSELKKSFGVVAVDLLTMQEVYITEGELMPAIRSTIAVPGIVSPFEYKQFKFVDGGVLNPVPVDLARRLGADIVIAVDLDFQPEVKNPESVRDILLRSIEIMKHRIRIDNMIFTKPDIVIKPNLKDIAFFDYHKHKISISEGYRATMEQIELIKKIIKRKITFLKKTEDYHPKTFLKIAS
ncbi:MAG: patatin-like phospholipase family protein [Leptospiraceae bacterium]|nr:patatin-like phospholipase family protein [Leptospiraceae bacterium]MDW7975637.1 patatin-like phospholipase family protein [Leptospiraceae bacterium]